jgi:hypothetical protein
VHYCLHCSRDLLRVRISSVNNIDGDTVISLAYMFVVFISMNVRVGAEQQNDLFTICRVKLIQRFFNLARNGLDEERVRAPAVNNRPADIWI